MAQLMKEVSSGNDWCHVCGGRGQRTFVLIDYPANAEHDKKNTKFLRICKDCVEAAHKLVNDPAGGKVKVGGA